MDISVSASVPGIGPVFTVDGQRFEVPGVYDAVVREYPGAEDYEVHLSVEVTRTGPRAERVELRQLHDDYGRPAGPYVTGAALRRVPVASMIEATIREAVEAVVSLETDEHGTSGKLRSATDDERDDFYRAWRSRGRGGRHVIDERFLQHVAEVYRAALVRGDPPTQTVADVLGGARSSAGRWVMQARQEGHLGAAPTQRAAGEADNEGGSQ